MSKKNKGFLTTGGERASYGLYFPGQNIFYMLIYSFLSTYYRDAGIAAAALATSLASAVLAWLGFKSGEGAVQAADFTGRFFGASIWLPVIGSVLSLILLHFYRLNDKDVEIMAKCNAGEISKEEAEMKLSRKY